MKKLFILALILSASLVDAAAQDDRLSKSSLYHFQRSTLFELLPAGSNDIVFVGNSITDGCEWAELMGNPNVKNRGISADKTYEVLSRLDAITSGKPRKIFVTIGTNDIGEGRSPQFVARYMERIIDKIRADTPATELYIQSILPVNDGYNMWFPHLHKSAEIVEANALIKEICEAEGVTYIDMWPVLAGEDGMLKPVYTNDGLHLAGPGYIAWRDALRPYMASGQEPEVTPPAPNSYHVRRADLFAKLPVGKQDMVFIGNSITDGGEWAEFFPGKPVKNRGISADRTYHVLDRLDPVIEGQPAKIFLMIGTNDLGAGFSPEFTAGNVEQIVERILAETPATKLYVQTVFPVNDAFGQAHRHVNRDAEIARTNELIKKICAHKGVEVIDMWSALADGNGKLRPEYTNDGLHLTGEGYLRWVEVLRPHVD